MNYKLFAGIDISKKKTDVVFFLSQAPDQAYHQCFENNKKGCLEMLNWIASLTAVSFQEMLFCAEDTGLYTLPLCTFFSQQQGKLWIENPLRLKRSLGLKRGKSDKADALQIAQYAFLHRSKAILYQLPSKTLTTLKNLISCRKQLLKHQTALKSTCTELNAFDKETASFTLKIRAALIKEHRAKIRLIDEKLLVIIREDAKLQRQYQLVKSVHGIGVQTAMLIVVTTQGFTLFTDSRKFACYCGLAPFENSSGSSLKGKSKVSHLANKKLKALLTMCALNTIKKDNEFKRYYDRRMKEGKHHSSVLNALRSKLVSRAFAAVLNDRPYIKEYHQAA
ncbi:IS110 family transposase [Pedobacter sp. HMF7647]|uniref:IS110 family transposase n=1 Tax=Hufsiella arboris TaxID=2695275 RepID=A0A7K1YFH8_9SPHI|nr:IS110 family transposase [Hufsiella arboris]MXV53356.1 IS110 family transposase [Hufsiella arboris]